MLGEVFFYMKYNDQWKDYIVYGTTIHSDFPFTVPLPSCNDIGNLSFTCTFTPPVHSPFDQVKPSYISSIRVDEKNPLFYLYQLDGVDIFKFPNCGEFYLWPERIVFYPTESNVLLRSIELRFLSTVLCYWLELHGVIILHSSVIKIKNGLEAFSSNSGGGKSTLAASFLQNGAALCSDDILAIKEQNGHFWGYPGYPEMRMWPDEARYFLGSIGSIRFGNSWNRKISSSSWKRKVWEF